MLLINKLYAIKSICERFKKCDDIFNNIEAHKIAVSPTSDELEDYCDECLKDIRKILDED